MVEFEIQILNWNLGGAKYLKEEEEKRKETRKLMNLELNHL